MIIGIDLGTTNSAVGVWRDGRAELIPNSLGHLLTPSAVGLDEDGSLLVGLSARERRSTHPNLTANLFKRYMGTRRLTTLGDRQFLPEELSSLVLASLKRDAEAFLGEAVTEAVITVPAYFNDRQRKATRWAGELAGLKVERLLNEPTAAALAYGIHNLEDESRFLVFDLGGGTFDVSILEMFEGVIEVRSSTGDNRLGGEDFNEAIMADMRTRFGGLGGEGYSPDGPLGQKLRVAAETVRRGLTDGPTARAQMVWKDKAFDYELSADRFEILCADLMKRLRDPVLRALKDGDINPSNLKEIVLVGGSTRMPIVRRAVTRMFGRFPSTTVHPDEAVAIGAAIQAGLKARDVNLSEVVLTDVCPYTLGVNSAEMQPDGSHVGGLFAPIIERNTIVPVSRVRPFRTLKHMQRDVTFVVYQGESRHVSENIRLGEITIPVPPKKAGQVEVECRFTYDINGLIEVDVRVPETKAHRQLVIAGDLSLSAAELAARREALAALKVHPKDLEANRAAMARGTRCYESTLGHVRQEVGELISQFQAALDRQDVRGADKARGDFLAGLDAIEGETYL
jgi:molecular chaperone HscC